ncbi:TIGR03808 family TAT-translocated repetitive protein [Hoeflea marina]|nr:TIGR03808 family TAT-translocated repetitive protein [Hoeflea marina]
MREHRPTFNRRGFVGGLIGSTALAACLARPARAQELFSRIGLRGALDADLNGLLPDVADDQSRMLQQAINGAARDGKILWLPAGSYVVSNIDLPDGARIAGVAGATRLIYGGRGHCFVAEGGGRIELSGLVIDGANQRLGEHVTGLVHLRGVSEAVIEDVDITGSSGHALTLEGCGGHVSGCHFSGAAQVGLYAVGSTGLAIRDNVVSDCGNGGILVHRWSPDEDGTIVSGNRVMRIAARAGGTGQNGNGINIFRAGNVMVTGNHVSDCAFSAIRANSADNIQIVGNQAIRSGETGLYAEFEFQGALIANNVVDGATLGISVANFNEGGRLAVVSGNIVRNLVTQGPYPAENAGFGIGIGIEADCSVTGNTVDGAPKWGILAGWGPYLRAVNISGNVVRRSGAGVAVSVVEDSGSALISDNVFQDTPDGAVVGCRWNEVVTGDLTRPGAERFSHLTIADNAVG